MTVYYPTIPALESIPYEHQEQHRRLVDLFGEGNSAELSEGQRIVFDNEVARLTDISAKLGAMIDRINSDAKRTGDSVNACRNLLTVLKSGIDGLAALAHKTTVLDMAQSYAKEGVDVLHSTYDTVKEEVEGLADKTLGKAIAPAIWIVAVLLILMVIVLRVKA